MRARTFIASIVFACTATAAAAEPADLLDWIKGHWMSCAGGEQTVETWIEGRSGLLAGINVSDRGFEFVRIDHLEGVLSYIASPGGGAATAFPLASMRENQVTFENPAHDFPQRVIYARKGDVLTARVEGEVDGKVEGMDWTFHAASLGDSCND